MSYIKIQVLKLGERFFLIRPTTTFFYVVYNALVCLLTQLLLKMVKEQFNFEDRWNNM